MSQEHVSVPAAFGSLLPWMTQVGHSEIGRRRAPSRTNETAQSDVHGDELTLAALHVSEYLLRQFFDDSPISVAVFDAAGRIQHVNRAFGAMLRYAPEGLMTRNIDELLLDPNDIPSIQERRRMLVEGRCNAFQIETRLATADRQEVWARMCGRLERHSDDRPPHIFAHIVDLTELEQTLENFRRDAEGARWMNWDPDQYCD